MVVSLLVIVEVEKLYLLTVMEVFVFVNLPKFSPTGYAYTQCYYTARPISIKKAQNASFRARVCLFSV